MQYEKKYMFEAEQLHTHESYVTKYEMASETVIKFIQSSYAYAQITNFI